MVTDRYKVVQNSEAFAFTDALLGEGVKYETAGSLQDGRKIWLLAKLPEKYIIEGEQIEHYLVFSSSHDGNGAIKVAMTPISCCWTFAERRAAAVLFRNKMMIAYAMSSIVHPLVEKGVLGLTLPEKFKSKNQRYYML